MTDDHTPTTDELASADLDGEVTPDEHARVESDPLLRARREELRSASAALTTPVPPLDPSVLDEVVRRAMDEADVADAGAAALTTTGPVRSLPERRARRGPPPFLVAAAVVALVAIGLAVVLSSRSRTQSSLAGKATAGDTGDKSASAGGSAAERRAVPAAPDATGGPTGEAPSAALDRDLGEFASADALREALRARFPAPAPVAGQGTTRPATSFSQTQVDRCTGVIEARDERLRQKDRLHVAPATIRGEPVLVLEYRTTAVVGKGPTTRVVAVGIAACEDRINFER